MGFDCNLITCKMTASANRFIWGLQKDSNMLFFFSNYIISFINFPTTTHPPTHKCSNIFALQIKFFI